MRKVSTLPGPVPEDKEPEVTLTILLETTRMKLKELPKITDLLSETLGFFNYQPEILKIDQRSSSSLNSGNKASYCIVFSISPSLSKNPEENSK